MIRDKKQKNMYTHPVVYFTFGLSLLPTIHNNKKLKWPNFGKRDLQKKLFKATRAVRVIFVYTVYSQSYTLHRI